ncbi:MAG: conserved phage C-terminal domain-containing protein [Candidatus Kapaibacteriota bacterium]
MNEQVIQETIDYLNMVANTNYSYNFPSTIKSLNKLIELGYNYEDFKSVIDKKWKEWKGTIYQEFVRPTTLFGEKFENYLNEQPRVRKNTITKIASAVSKAKRTSWKLGDNGRR